MLDAAARRHGAEPDLLARLERLESGAEPDAAPASPGRAAAALATEAGPPPASPPPDALALAARLRAAGHEPPHDAELGDDAAGAAGAARRRARRADRPRHVRPRRRARRRARAGDAHHRTPRAPITLARLRDELGTSRKYAQALLEHLDAARVTRRRPDDSRVLRRS